MYSPSRFVLIVICCWYLLKTTVASKISSVMPSGGASVVKVCQADQAEVCDPSVEQSVRTLHV